MSDLVDAIEYPDPPNDEDGEWDDACLTVWRGGDRTFPFEFHGWWKKGDDDKLRASTQHAKYAVGTGNLRFFLRDILEKRRVDSTFTVVDLYPKAENKFPHVDYMYYYWVLYDAVWRSTKKNIVLCSYSPGIADRFNGIVEGVKVSTVHLSAYTRHSEFSHADQIFIWGFPSNSEEVEMFIKCIMPYMVLKNLPDVVWFGFSNTAGCMNPRNFMQMNWTDHPYTQEPSLISVATHLN